MEIHRSSRSAPFSVHNAGLQEPLPDATSNLRLNGPIGTDEATNLYLHFNPAFLPSLVQQIGRGDPLHMELAEHFAIRDAFIKLNPATLVRKLVNGVRSSWLASCTN